MSGGRVPQVDPLKRRGPFYRGYVRFLRTGAGRWVAINVAAPIDPSSCARPEDASEPDSSFRP